MHLRTRGTSQNKFFFPFSDMPPRNYKKNRTSSKKSAYGPELLHERIVGVDVGLALDDVEAHAPDPLFAQCEGEGVRADERAAGRVDEDGVLLSCAKSQC